MATNIKLPQGGRNNQQPMPGFDPQSALKSLLGMGSISNVGSLTNRGLDVATGVDAFEPSEADLMQEQLSPRGAGFSREQLRDQAMGGVKRILGMNQIEHEQQMETEAAKAQILADRAAASDAAIADRQIAAQDRMDARQHAGFEAADKRMLAAQQHAVSMQDDRQAADALKPATSATTLPTEGMDKRLAEARSAYNGFHPVNSIMRMIGMTPSADTQYKGSINTIMTRMNVPMELRGPITEAAMAGMTGPQAIAEAESQGAVLDPTSKNFILQILGQ